MDQLNEALKTLSSKNASFYAEAPLFVELLAAQAAKNQPVILISKSSDELITRLKNLRFFAEKLKTLVMPADERTAMHATATDPLNRMEKVSTSFQLTNGVPDILVMPPEALLERLPSALALQKHAQLLIKGERIDREHLIKSLVILGYSKVPTVLDRGVFAVRGSIIDIFINGEPHPVRLDLFGDEIDSIRYFDEITQRNMQAIDSIVVGGVKEVVLDKDTKALALNKLNDLADALNYPTLKLNEKLKDIEAGIHFYGIEKLLPAFYQEQSSILELYLSGLNKKQSPIIIFDDQEAIFAQLKSFSKNLDVLHEQAIVRGDLLFSTADYFLSLPELKKTLDKFNSANVSSFIKEDGALEFSSKSMKDIRQDIIKASTVISKDEEPHLLKPLSDRLKKLHKDGFTTIITVSSFEHEKELKRLLEPLGINLSKLNDLAWALENPKAFYQPHIQAYTKVCKHPLAFGAAFEFAKLALIAEDDIFGKRTKRKDQSGKQGGFKTSVSDLELNDFVVHVDHGIGQFKGLVRLNVRGIDNDYVLLHYANDEKLYLPTHRINLIKPHGTKDGSLRLDKLGSTAWVSKKNKVKEAVMAMAQDLLKLYAKREVVTRPPFSAPDTHYVEFEANFEFETTHDQQKAIDDVLADMQKPKPMDRLVCGDVGYGKTEVAMRAAMLAVLSKKQVALLSPTTVLAQQHGLTFEERFKNTGVSIAVLSRFQKATEIKEILKKVKNNQIDIVIGTHRLLSDDVHFNNLGLIVVDEEQRFGIKAKEHLKKMRTKVDVLTMSATPIPRTMQMSYFGIRDLSIIETPPVDRRAIQTQVVQFDDAVIREAIMRELSRGGQVYFVHNRVQSIAATADYLKDLVPEAKIAVGHGQMNEKDLEKVMISFIEHKINVLVCTTIIETGIDVSTANTMFINDADDFGLSQLYQLRGRIGRSKERAFAYLLIKQKTEDLTPIARTRLEILHKFSELGAGFRIAQHDLELRGAGDLLGKNQHGHMAAVGYDLYADLLQEAVKALKGQVDDETIDPEVTLPISALISEKYCPDLHDRMTFYQRLASADNVDSLESAITSLEELYGEAPPEVLALKVSTELKLELKRIKAIKMDISRGKDATTFIVSMSLSTQAPINHQKLLDALKDPKSLKLTPQHKVIQTINISNSDILAALLDAGIKAIREVENGLF